jgi:glycosyltransferase involved in cell wall biosynthesis
VVLNARTVVADIEKYYPRHKAKLVAMPFCPPANARNIELDEVRAAQVKYKLPKEYFMISNQFWVHKSHDTAFLAVAKLHSVGQRVHLVCTGHTDDYRHPNHFQHLQELLQDLGIESSVHILGLIPKEEQLALMQGALAVVQPTLFEGGPGGGAIYNAISLGVPCIVSDIEVNLEIDLGNVRFFRAGSPDDLAAKMQSLILALPPVPKQEDLRTQLEKRQHEFANRILGIVEQLAE